MDPQVARPLLASSLCWVEVLGLGGWAQQLAAAAVPASTLTPALTSTNQRSCGHIRTETRREQVRAAFFPFKKTCVGLFSVSCLLFSLHTNTHCDLLLLFNECHPPLPLSSYFCLVTLFRWKNDTFEITQWSIASFSIYTSNKTSPGAILECRH